MSAIMKNTHKNFLLSFALFMTVVGSTLFYMFFVNNGSKTVKLDLGSVIQADDHVCASLSFLNPKDILPVKCWRYGAEKERRYSQLIAEYERQLNENLLETIFSDFIATNEFMLYILLFLSVFCFLTYLIKNVKTYLKDTN